MQMNSVPLVLTYREADLLEDLLDEERMRLREARGGRWLRRRTAMLDRIGHKLFSAAETAN
jgi:hypothetical protein